MPKRNGAEIIVDCLIKEGVEVVFGYPGGAVIPIYDVLYDSDLRHILTRHEQGAAHAADGYARATGKVGVCMATSGPGATNLVTGIATAYMDSSPLVAITGQVPTSFIGRDSFQEADITGITMPITKHNYLVHDAADLPKIMREAFYLARNGRPGPVLIDVPKDVSLDEVDYNFPALEELDLPKYNGNSQPENWEPSNGEIKRVVRLLSEAERPVIYAGGGVMASEAAEELRELVQKFAIPVVTTLMGLGSYPEEDEYSLGMLGMHGTWYANKAVTECDLLVAMGARFDDRVTGALEKFAPGARIVHIDVDPAEINKIVDTDCALVGDLKSVLKNILEHVNGDVDSDTMKERRQQWLSQVSEWKDSQPLGYDHGEGIPPQYIVEKIYEITKGEAIIATEVGQHQMWAAQYYKFSRPRSIITSGGLGTMGFGLPAAIGAQVGCPDRIVFDIAGDGSIQMNIQELSTLAAYDLPVNVAVFNNCYLGMVRQWQEFFQDSRYSETRLECSPDFAQLAEVYGLKGLRINKKEDVEDAVREAVDTDGPVIMDFRVNQEENVFPMVPPGGALNEMMTRKR